MESLKESPSVILTNRAQRDRIIMQQAVRESLLTDSTSGIVKGEGDTTSIDSFSSPDADISYRETLLDLENCLLVPKSVQRDKDFDGIKFDSENNNGKKNNKSVQLTNNAFEAVEVGKVIEDQKLVSNDDKKVTIPDGGWGWVVVLSSFIISMIADGISFSFGLLYIEFLDEFQASKSTTAWIGSLFIAVPLLSGPVMSALVDRYGCRSMTILGGIISTIGFVLASISTTLEMMLVTFGVIAGLGLGLVYVTAVVSIAYWFEKKRNLAVGLGACGTGVGTFIYAPMTQYFIDEFGWRGTILLLSGTLLNLCVCGCVMRDPEWWILEQKQQRSSKDDEKSNKEDAKSKHSSTVSNACFDAGSDSRRTSMNLSPENEIKGEEIIVHNEENNTNKNANKRNSNSLFNIPTYLTYDDKATKGILNELVNDAEAKVTSPESHSSEKKDDLQSTNSQLKHSQSGTKENKPLIKQDSKDSKRDWFKKQLSINHHYLKDLKMPLNSISHRNAMLNIKRYKLKASSCPDIFKNSMITVNEQEEKWYDDCVSCLADMFNVSLFKKVTFNLLCFGTIIIFVWFIVPYFYLAEHMIQEGYPEEDGAFMLSLIGITNTIGMVTLGWIGDFPQVSISNLYAVCLILCGASVAAIPKAASNYWILASVCSSFGLLFAASFTFTPSLLVTLVSLDDFTSAYGLVLLAQGIGHLIGPPLSGLIYDLTSSWELSFYLAGGWIILAGVLISFIHPVKKYQQKQEAAKELESSSMA